MIKNEVVYINVGIMDDEPKARQRAIRIIDNWSLDIQKPGEENSKTKPLLWNWLMRKVLKEKQAIDKNAKLSEPDVINVKARILITAQTSEEFESKIDERTKFRDLDVIVSDVVTPEDKNDGLNFAKRWNNKSEAPIFIMVSAHDFAVKAVIEIDVADYILKPLRTDTLSVGLCKALTKKAAKDHIDTEWDDNVHVKPVVNVTSAGLGYHSLPIDNVVMFKSETKCTMAITYTKEYFSEFSLRKISEMYKGYFVKVRRNYLISLEHIVGFTNEAKRERTNKDVKGRVWFIKVKMKDDFEYIEIARREWSKIYKYCDINPNIACNLPIVNFDEEMKSRLKQGLLDEVNEDEDEEEID